MASRFLRGDQIVLGKSIPKDGNLVLGTVTRVDSDFVWARINGGSAPRPFKTDEITKWTPSRAARWLAQIAAR